MDDFVFTFDVNPFKSAIDQITTGFDSLRSTLENFSNVAQGKSEQWIKNTSETIKKTSRKMKQHTETSITNFSENASKMISALTKRVLGLGAAYLSIRKALQYIPEIGRAFRHAGDIALRSFLWPLRKLLIPVLNDLLAWVRDHRIMFVRWGSVLANAFKAVFTIVKSVINLIKTLAGAFIDKFEQMFGKTTTKLSDVMNILMFKFTVLVEYLTAILTPVAEKIGALVANIVGLFRKFFEGIAEGAGNIKPYFADILGQLGRLFELITNISDSAGVMGKAFKTLGIILGATLQPFLAGIGQTIDIIASGVEKLMLTLKAFKAWREDDTAGLRKALKEREQVNKDFQERFEKRWKAVGAGLTEAGKGIGKTWTEPVKESKSSTSKNVKIETKIDMGKTEINIKTEGDAKKAGENFAMGMSHTLNRELRKMVNDAALGVAS